MEEYHTGAEAKTPEARRYRGISYQKPINRAKELIPVIDLADWLCGPGGLKRIGKEWVGRCPLPDHQDRNPSFAVNVEKNVWFCHGCLRGGSTVELARLAWAYTEREAHVAAAELLMEFGYELPNRPPAWYCKEERQKPVRAALEEVKVRSARRRLMRTFLPLLAEIEDEAERDKEAQKIWRDLEQAARLLVKGGAK